jgi:two-component system response regulator ChvI
VFLKVFGLFGQRVGKAQWFQRWNRSSTKAIPDRVAAKDAANPKEADAKALEWGQLRMDPERHICGWKAEALTLTVTEFLILKALATRPGVVRSHNTLWMLPYDDQVYVDDRAIDSQVKRLRKKFRAVDDAFDMIETLYGAGYRFKEA